LNRQFSLIFINRKISVKAELLTVHTRCHQCQQYGRRADQRNDRNIILMRQSYKSCARVCNCRQSGFG
jgi:hypothetical protein